MINFNDIISIFDVFFSIYRVADVSETVGFTLCGPFARYTDLQPLLDEGEWDDITEILDSRVARDEPEPEDTGETGRDGRLTFDRLDPGLFLVMSEPYRIGKTTYYLSTSLVCVPGLTSDDTWEYDTVSGMSVVKANLENNQEVLRDLLGASDEE